MNGETGTEQDQGSVIVLVALALTALLGFAAIVVDLGILYVRHAELQSALDAAALAGVQELPHNPGQAQQTAEAYAVRNGVSPVTVDFAYGNSEITVSAEETVPTYFARVWGLSSNTISAKSKAMMVPPVSMSGAVPLAVEEQDFVYGAEYVLKSGPHEPDEHEPEGRYSGWFGALQLTGPGARDYETDLTYGYDGTLEVGQILNLEHGNMSGSTMRAIEARFARDNRTPQNTFDDYERDAPQLVYIPVVKIVSHNGNSIHEVEIVGFAAFFLEGVEGVGNDSIVTGRFLQTIAPNSQNDGRLNDVLAQEDAVRQGGSINDFGVGVPKLVQ